jgi:predicted MPP superfamily phosphohydrolase
MKKIIHLSDLHVGYNDCGAKLEQLVTEIIEQHQPASNYVIVITGDTRDVPK